MPADRRPAFASLDSGLLSVLTVSTAIEISGTHPDSTTPKVEKRDVSSYLPLFHQRGAFPKPPSPSSGACPHASLAKMR